MHNIAAVPHIVTAPPQAGMAVQRAESPQPTVRLARDNKLANRVGLGRAILKLAPGTGPPPATQAQANDQPTATQTQGNDPLTVSPAPPIEARAVEAVMLSEADQEDTTEAVLAPLAAAVPQAWALAAEAVGVAEDDGDKRSGMLGCRL